MEPLTVFILTVIAVSLQSIGSFLIWASIAKNAIKLVKKEWENEDHKS